MVLALGPQCCCVCGTLPECLDGKCFVVTISDLADGACSTCSLDVNDEFFIGPINVDGCVVAERGDFFPHPDPRSDGQPDSGLVCGGAGLNPGLVITVGIREVGGVWNLGVGWYVVNNGVLCEDLVGFGLSGELAVTAIKSICNGGTVELPLTSFQSTCGALGSLCVYDDAVLTLRVSEECDLHCIERIVSVLTPGTEPCCYDWDWELQIPGGCNCRQIGPTYLHANNVSQCVDYVCDDDPEVRTFCITPPGCPYECCDCIESIETIGASFQGWPSGCTITDGTVTIVYYLEELNRTFICNVIENSAYCYRGQRLELGTLSDTGDRGLLLAVRTDSADPGNNYVDYLYQVYSEMSCQGLPTPNEGAAFTELRLQRFYESGGVYTYAGNGIIQFDDAGLAALNTCSMNNCREYTITDTFSDIEFFWNLGLGCTPFDIFACWRANHYQGCVAP